MNHKLINDLKTIKKEISQLEESLNSLSIKIDSAINVLKLEEDSNSSSEPEIKTRGRLTKYIYNTSASRIIFVFLTLVGIILGIKIHTSSQNSIQDSSPPVQNRSYR